MDAIELLSRQHREVETLFEMIRKATGARKRRLVEDLADRVAAHSEIEERIFYPRLRAEEQELIAEAYEAHAKVGRALGELLAADDLDDEPWTTRLEELQDEIERHVEEEESEIFDAARSVLGDELDDVGGEMEAMFAELIAEGTPRTILAQQAEEAWPA